MRIDPEIQAFALAVGARVPDPCTEVGRQWRNIFKRGNYFIFRDKLMIVKISRLEKPFWGVGHRYIFENDFSGDYYLVLLTPKGAGWSFRKSQVENLIGNGTWKQGNNGDYKINCPLPDKYHFFSSDDFLKRF